MASKRSPSANPATLPERCTSRLTRGWIIAAAPGVPDDAGAEGVSLREVARRPGVHPAPLDGHMGGGRDVPRAYAAVLKDLVPPPAEDPAGRERLLRARAEEIDPAAHPMVAAQLPLLPNRGFTLRRRSGDAEAFLPGLEPPGAG